MTERIILWSKISGIKVMYLMALFYVVLFTFSCRTAKLVSEPELLRVASNIEMAETRNVSKPHRLEEDLSGLIDPKPKYGIGNWRLGLNQRIKQPKKEKGFKHWLKNKVGAKPEFYSYDRAEKNRQRIEKYLKDQGYFNGRSEVDTIIQQGKIRVNHKVWPGAPYHYQHIVFQNDSSLISNLLRASSGNCELKTGDQYNTEGILKEQGRLVENATNHGFLEIGRNDILFYLDTIQGTKLVDVYIRTKLRADSLDHHPYYLRDTWVYQNYSISRPDSQSSKDTIDYDGLSMIQQDEFLKPKSLSRSILQRKKDLYSKELTEYTVARLLDLDVYKFVNIEYKRNADTTSNLADRLIYLTPGEIRDISAEIKANTRAGNYLGSGVKLTYTDRNLLGGAERFEASISGEVETQLGDDGPLINSAQAEGQFKLLLPYFFPFSNSITVGPFTPKTQVNLSFKFEKRSEFYTINSFTLHYGYNWRASLRRQHQLYPVVINRINVLEKTEELENVLAENPSLRSSFENVYIAGMQYIFTYSNKKAAELDPYYYFRANLESAGNSTYLFNRIVEGVTNESYSLLGLPFAQFLKSDFDFRYYFPLKKSIFVTRFFTGVGIAYGNQKVMPYVKQYYSGGSNGLRAFPIRTLGPGSYLNPNINSGENEFLDQTGDIKLEANLEYRFGLLGYLKGALFVDAGNIWLMREDNDTREGGVFQFNEFYREVAIGSGIGLRLDISSFIVRLDVAFPLRVPYLPKGDRWTVNKIELFDRSWRKDNLVWNLALGYPF